MNPKNLLCQFKIELLKIEPVIWRRIQVPREYSFWDLHVAIQDAMGWLDYHLHEFEIKGAHKNKPDFIGIPDDEFPDDRKILPSWERPIKYHIDLPGRTAVYRYDFGDGWEHSVLLEAISLKEKGQKYPICLDGERACPPEDCGGVSGYHELMEIVKDPKHPEYDSMCEWLDGHAQSYWPDNPDNFDPQSVKFDSPKKRYNLAFQRSM